jgi:hypothetical protein
MKIDRESVKNFALICLVACITVGSLLGWVSYLRIDRDEYRMKKIEDDSARAIKGVEDMRDKLLLPRMATPEEINAQIKAK